jgi:hypothetical protein
MDTSRLISTTTTSRVTARFAEGVASYPDQVRAAERAEIRRRYRRRGKIGMSTLRTAELDRLFDHRCRGIILPDDDAGRGDVRIMLHTLGRRSEPIQRIEAWLRQRAPWFDGEERDRLIEAVLDNPLRWRADTLGRMLGLTTAERTMLKIRTIGPIDSTAAERKEARRIAGIERKRSSRRAAGVGPRPKSDGKSLNAQAPWRAEGINRSTWFRRRARDRNATSRAAV